MRDLLCRHDEELPEGRPLLAKVMEAGRRLEAGRVSLERARERAKERIGRLPARIRSLEDADPPYPVVISAALARARDRALERAGE